MLSVDRSSSTPLYEQIKVILRDRILDGTYADGETLPTERALCSMFGVSRITVVRALNELANLGFISRRQGRGSAVISERIEENLSTIVGFSRSMREQGINVSSKLLSREAVVADDRLRMTFALPEDYPGNFVKIRRLRYVDDIPAVIFVTIITEETDAAIQGYNLEENSLYSLYSQITGLQVIRSEVTLVPVMATPEIIQHFDVKPATAHFWYRSVSYLANEQPIETTTALYRGDMFQFKSMLHATGDETPPKDPWYINPELISETK